MKDMLLGKVDTLIEKSFLRGLTLTDIAYVAVLCLLPCFIVGVNVFTTKEHAKSIETNVLNITSNQNGDYVWETPATEEEYVKLNYIEMKENGQHEQKSVEQNLAKVIHVEGLEQPYLEENHYTYSKIIDWVIGEELRYGYSIYIPK